MKPRIRHIIFDLDGTLVDSSLDITNALNHALGPHGLPPLTVEKTITLVGEGIGRLIEKVLPEGLSQKRDEILSNFLRYYEEHISDYSHLYPGVIDTLDMLKGRVLSVVTNKRERLSVKLLEDLGIARHFRSIIGPDTAGEKKPSPRPVLLACERAGVKTEETVMVGDSDIDIRTGKAAGLVTIAVPYGYRPPEMLKEADFILGKDLRDLPLLLEEIEGNHSL
jgi:phosphoglycolate phosphatase